MDDLIATLHANLEEKCWGFVPHTVVRKVFENERRFPAPNDNEHSFHAFWDDATPQIDENDHDVYPYKGSLVSYYGMDLTLDFNSKRVMTSVTDEMSGEFPRVIEYIDPTTVGQESKLRFHRQWAKEADYHPVILTLQNIIFEVLKKQFYRNSKADGPSDVPPTDDNSKFEAMMTAYRVTKGANDAAQPGPEGVHQDSADLTVIVLVNRKNITEDSGGNRIWTLEQACGKPTDDDLKSDRLLYETILHNRFDCLFVLDRKVKHEALAFEIAQGESNALRDVLTFEVRKPRVVESSKF